MTNSTLPTVSEAKLHEFLYYMKVRKRTVNVLYPSFRYIELTKREKFLFDHIKDIFRCAPAAGDKKYIVSSVYQKDLPWQLTLSDIICSITVENEA